MPEFKSPSLATSPLLTQGGQLTSMSDATSGGAASMPHVEQPEPSGLRFGTVTPAFHRSSSTHAPSHPLQHAPRSPLALTATAQPYARLSNCTHCTHRSH